MNVISKQNAADIADVTESPNEWGSKWEYWFSGHCIESVVTTLQTAYNFLYRKVWFNKFN